MSRDREGRRREDDVLPTPNQIDKRDELVTSYQRHTGKRKGINRHDIMRRLIDRADLSMLIQGESEEGA